MGARLDRRTMLKSIAAGAAALTAPHWLLAAVRAADKAGRKPNFIIIFTDDQGYQDLGCYGSPKIKTPRLDQMAAEGMRFTDFYVPSPVCTPSRSALMTGCYPRRIGMENHVLFPTSARGLNPTEITLAEVLKQQGYATMCIGKWHLGHHKPFLPTQQGFDRYFGIPFSNDMWLPANMAYAKDAKLPEGRTPEDLQAGEKKNGQVPLMRNERVIEYPVDQRGLTERYTAEALGFIAAHKDKPFFLYLPHTFPHIPLHTSDRFKGRSARGLYGDVIEAIDWSSGQILDALKAHGMDERTMVIFTSDNGPWLVMGKNGGCALPLRDGKGTTYEGGMREPCIVRWPGKIPAGTVCSEVATTMDLLPTIAKVAGTAAPTDRVIDGKDIWPLLSGRKDAKSPHEAFFYHTSNGKLAAVRCGKWKLHILPPRKAVKVPKDQPKPKPQPIQPELYDLQADIGENRNVYDEHPEVVARLRKLLADFDAEIKARSRPAGMFKETAKG